MKHHGTCKDASEIGTVLFWLIFNFCGFFAQISRLQANFCVSWQFATKENTKCHFNSSKMNNSLSCELISCHWRPSRICKNSKVGKKSQKLKINDKYTLHFSEAWCFMHQIHSRSSLCRWLKGFGDTSTYDWEISK